jgi:GNAT superfamily N-acetyltransferase
MINDLVIRNATKVDINSAYRVFETSIPDTYEKEGLGHMHEEMLREIEHKKHLLDTSLNRKGSGIYFIFAKIRETVVGTISFGPCGEDIKKCTEGQLDNVGELGSLYVLPPYQDQGFGSRMINAMLEHLRSQGIKQFCLDSGYKRAQKRWLRKFGEPYRVAKDYWGPGANHMIWLCKVNDFLEHLPQNIYLRTDNSNE